MSETKALPGQTYILEELEGLRRRLAEFSRQIRSADNKQLKVLYDQLAGELLTVGGQLLFIRYMSRAAIWLAAAAEANRKAATSARLLNFNELSKVVGNSRVRESYENVAPFIRRGYGQSDWLTTWMGSAIKANARSAASTVRRALRRARFLARVHWIVPRAAYVIWSFILLIVVVESFIDFGSHALVELFAPLAHLLAPYVDVTARQIEFLSKVVLLLVIGWLLVDSLKPDLERWQARLETREVQKFASDVMNASFQIRIYQAVVQIAFFDAASFAFEDQPNRPWLRPLLNWSVPKIESLKDLAPLTSL